VISKTEYNKINIGMKKLSILLAFFLITSISAQANTSPTLLFGYVSDNVEDYYEVMDYLEGINLTVIDYCEQERLIYVQLNEEYKDFAFLFEQIESFFGGKCYTKKGDIYDRGGICNEIITKQKLEK
jgi:hypothetical protein